MARERAGELDVILGIDMETDIGSWTPSWRGVLEGTPRLLELCDEAGVRATFLFTGEAAGLHAGVVREVVRRGHEVGCHSLYHETVGEPIFPLPGVYPILPEELDHRLALATEIVERASGTRPVSFRCPRLWGSTAVVNALERLGYLADLTYPLYFHRKQLTPYHPAAHDWREVGDLRILEIPSFADMNMVSTDEHQRDRDQWPLLRTSGAEVLLGKARDFVGVLRGKGLRPVLSFYVHPWEFVPMEPRYVMSEATVIFADFLIRGTGEHALAELGKLIQGLHAMGGILRTAREYAERVAEIT